MNTSNKLTTLIKVSFYQKSCESVKRKLKRVCIYIKYTGKSKYPTLSQMSVLITSRQYKRSPKMVNSVALKKNIKCISINVKLLSWNYVTHASYYCCHL